MISLRRPSEKTIRSFLARHAESSFSYSEVGATRKVPPSGYAVDHHRMRLGAGWATFDAGCDAIRRWEMFNIGWVTLESPQTPIETGQVVAVMAHAYGMWFLNACRIAYVISEAGSVQRYGFAYGTLAEHVEKGEEQFTVVWNHEDDSVWYDLLAFSRPGHLLVRLGNPIARRLQKRFALDSLEAMKRAVQSA